MTVLSCAHCRTPFETHQELCPNCGLPAHIEAPPPDLRLNGRALLAASFRLYLRTWLPLLVLCLVTCTLAAATFALTVLRQGEANAGPLVFPMVCLALIATDITLYLHLLHRALPTPLTPRSVVAASLRLFLMLVVVLFLLGVLTVLASTTVGPFSLLLPLAGLLWIPARAPSYLPLLLIGGVPSGQAWNESRSASRGQPGTLISLTLLMVLLEVAVHALLLTCVDETLDVIYRHNVWPAAIGIATLHLSLFAFPLTVCYTVYHQCAQQGCFHPASTR